MSTRLGTALRHGRQALAGEHGARRWIVVITDGEPHDVDVHDPRYLVHDARQAVQAASREGIVAACIGLEAGSGATTRAIFGQQHCESLPRIDALPGVLARLLAPRSPE